MAPAWRSGFQNPRIEFELPVACTPIIGLTYSFSFAGACSTRTRFQSASSSSATIIDSEVYTPCPISTCGLMSVTTPFASMRMNALGANGPALDCALAVLVGR